MAELRLEARVSPAAAAPGEVVDSGEVADGDDLAGPGVDRGEADRLPGPRCLDEVQLPGAAPDPPGDHPDVPGRGRRPVGAGDEDQVTAGGLRQIERDGSAGAHLSAGVV